MDCVCLLSAGESTKEELQRWNHCSIEHSIPESFSTDDSSLPLNHLHRCIGGGDSKKERSETKKWDFLWFGDRIYRDETGDSFPDFETINWKYPRGSYSYPMSSKPPPKQTQTHRLWATLGSVWLSYYVSGWRLFVSSPDLSLPKESCEKRRLPLNPPSPLNHFPCQ